MPDKKQTWLSDDEASALDYYETQRAQDAWDIAERDEADIKKAQEAWDAYDKTGKVPQPERPTISEAVKNITGPDKALGESFMRAAKGQGNILDPYRKYKAEQNEPYFKPEAVLTNLASFVKGIFGEEGPKPEMYVSEPREEYKKKISEPLYDSQGYVNPDVLISSDLPRGTVNDILLKSYSAKYKIPLEKLKTLSSLRLAAHKDDNAVTTVLKTLGQALDNLLFNVPTSQAVNVYKLFIRADDSETGDFGHGTARSGNYG